MTLGVRIIILHNLQVHTGAQSGFGWSVSLEIYRIHSSEFLIK